MGSDQPTATDCQRAAIVTDTNVLINLLHIGQLPLLGVLEPYQFLAPEEVLGEMIDPAQREETDAAICRGDLSLLDIDSVEYLALFSELRDVMGRGEAACLALAKTKRWHIASDEKKCFRRRAIEWIGKERILRTELILLEAIRFDCITVPEADGFKAVLEAKRYSMPFKSFADLLGGL